MTRVVEREIQTSTHLLVTLLPATARGPATYTCGDARATADFSSVALLDLLPTPPDTVFAVCTPEAVDGSWETFRKQVHSRDSDGEVEVQLVEISDIEDVAGFLEELTGEVNQVVGDIPIRLTVDVTQGFRHLSFLTYVATLYLQALNSVEIEGAWYGLLRRDHDEHPFLDLKPLLDLPRWTYALDVLDATGSALPRARWLSEIPDDQNAQRIARDLEYLSEAHGSGLPLELGDQAAHFQQQNPKSMRRLLRKQSVPLGNDLVGRLTKILSTFALRNHSRGDGWKKNVELSRSELLRQAKIIDDHLERESRATALGMMNEWTVSWVLWREGEAGESWLDYKPTRRRAAAILGNLRELSAEPALGDMLAETHKGLATFWDNLGNLRNAFSHHGMRGQDLVSDGDVERRLEEVKDFWHTLREAPEWNLGLSTSGETILISPVGNRTGVLFSALKHCQVRADPPYRCIAVCSEQSSQFIDEAVERASVADVEIERLILDNPFGGLDEFEELLARAKPTLARAEEVYVNVTGGTTLMGLLAQKLAELASSLQRPVHRFGLIDRRGPAAQEKDPYQQGDVLWLSSDDSNAESGG